MFNLKFSDIMGKNNKKLTTEEFVKKAKEVHGDKYDYSKVDYINSKTKVCIICPIHGEFWQSPSDHINKKCGCNTCRRTKSKILTPIENKKQMREYSIWKDIHSRVTNKNLEHADRYIERGIDCCDEWMESFEQFYADMGPCPEGYSIDRINNDLGYSPDNCRWASCTEQSQNRGTFNKLFTYKGETKVLKEWARVLGIKYTTLYQRIYRSGLSFEEAIEADPFDKSYEINGEMHTMKEWCNIYNIKFSTVCNRVNKYKWDIEKALTTPIKSKN